MLKTILVALDAEASAHRFTEQVLQTLKELQLNDYTKVILSHVVPVDSEHLDVVADRPTPDLERFPYAGLEKQLQRYRNQIPCLTEVEVVAGDPAEEIVRLARIYHTDLIVIGSRGLVGMEKILKRSVSAQVMEEAPCSVLVVKLQG
jgi:nucleotide-binding universal stress UspA family protein